MFKTYKQVNHAPYLSTYSRKTRFVVTLTRFFLVNATGNEFHVNLTHIKIDIF